MAEYDFDIVHRPEKQHANADALSRYLVSVNAVTSNKQWRNPAFKNNFKKQQNKDSLTATLLVWVTKATRPKAEQMEGAYRELCYYWAMFDELSIEDGILGILNSIVDGPDRRFCAIVPQQAKQEILELAHGSSAGGHFGVQKTVDKLTQRFHWNQLILDVQDWCFKCPTCNRH